MPALIGTGELTIVDIRDGLTIGLSNTNHSVPTDENGENGDYTNCSSTIAILVGSTDDTANWTIQAIPSVGVVGVLNSKTYTVTNMTVDVGTVDFVASRIGFTDLVVRFTISKNRAGKSASQISVVANQKNYITDEGLWGILINDGLQTGQSRGHKLVILDPATDSIISNTNYDTYAADANVNSLAAAINAVADGMIVILTTWDATACNQTLRDALRTCGSDSIETWAAERRSHAFIGQKGIAVGGAYEKTGIGNTAAGTSKVFAYYGTSGIVKNGSTAVNAISAVLTNDAHSFTALKDGTVSSYAGSGTEIRVYDGTQLLIYDAVGTSVGTWKITTSAQNITVGTITDSGDFATVNNHSAITADTAIITYTITGKTKLGNSFTLVKSQTFSKSKAGDNAISIILSNEAHTITASNTGVIAAGAYAGSGTEIRVYDGADLLIYDAVGTASGTWKITTSAQNITIGTITDSGDFATIGNQSNMTADTATITYTITGKNKLGISFTATKIQSFSKSKAGDKGDTGTRGTLSLARAITGTSWSDTETSTAITDAGGVSPLPGDVVTLYNVSAGFSETRIRGASTWNAITGFYGGDVILDNSLSANKIKANSITSDQISANAITADEISANAITADKLTANAVTADKIAAGAITADKIAAGAITADNVDTKNLTIKDDAGNIIFSSSTKIGGGNLLFNSSFDYDANNDGIPDGWTSTSIGSGITFERSLVDSTAASGKAFRLNIAALNSPSTATHSIVQTTGNQVQVLPNTTYTLSFMAKTSTLSYKLYNSAFYYAPDGTTAEGSSGASYQFTSVDTWERVTRTITTTANTKFIRVRFGINRPAVSNTTLGSVEVDLMQLEEGDTATSYKPSIFDTVNLSNRLTSTNASTWIEDAAIGSAQVGQLTASNIAAGAITADKIGAGAITADKIGAGAITADKIGAGEIVTSKLTVLSNEFVNPVSSTRNLNGWGGISETGVGSVSGLSYNSTENAIQITSSSSHHVHSQSFQVNQNKIYRVTFKIKKSAATGQFYAGLAAYSVFTGGGFDTSNGQGTENVTPYNTSRVAGTASSNQYFQSDTPSTSYVEYVSYIIGSNRNINDCPAHIGSAGNPYMKLSANANWVSLRFLNWANSASTNLFVKDVSVTEVEIGQIVGDNISPNSITAEKIVAGAITADRIDTRGLSIKDASGNVILAAGTALDWSNVGGTGKPTDNATVGAPAGTYIGDTLAETVEARANSVTSKLDKASSDILNVNTTSTTRVAGIRAGDIAWNSSGDRTSGKGVALTPSGMIGHNGTKTTFAINATTGDATFGGTLNVSSASGNARVEITNSSIKVYDENGKLRVHIGDLTQ